MLRHQTNDVLSSLPRTVTPVEMSSSSLPDEVVHRREDYLDQVFSPLTGSLPFLRRQELRREIQYHLNSMIAAYIEMGKAPEAACNEAFAQFGKPKEVSASIKRSSASNTSWNRVYNWWTLPRLSMAALLPVFLLVCLTYLGSTSLHSRPTPTNRSSNDTVMKVATVAVGFSHNRAALRHPCTECHSNTTDFIQQGKATIPIEGRLIKIQMDQKSKPSFAKLVK